MSETNKQLAVRWFEEVWNRQNAAVIDELFAPDGKCHGFPTPDAVFVGPEAFKSLHSKFIGAFPDQHFTLEAIVAEGDLVAVRWRVDLTHLGDHLGTPATGKTAYQVGATFFQFKDGVIVEGWNEMDMNFLGRQLEAS